MNKLLSTHARAELALVFVISFFLFGLISISLGQDINWDLKNYHYYGADSFFRNRFLYDFLPAQLQTFHNPLLHLLSYSLIKNLQPVVAGFVLGGIQGINFFLSYLIARSTLRKGLASLRKVFISLLLASVGTCSPLFISEIGTTLGDNLISLLVLASILLVLRSGSFDVKSLKNGLVFVLAGVLLGISGGLKLTNLVFALAFLITLIFLSRGLSKIKLAIQALFGIIIGFLISSGSWMLFLYQEYKNPLFPYYNAIFKSPYFVLANIKDERWIPENFLDGLSYPFQWAVGIQNPSSELPFRDIRWAMAVCIMVPVCICFLLKKIRFSKAVVVKEGKSDNSQLTEPFARKFIILFTSISFFIWLFQFGYSRYLMPLDLVSSIYILCLIDSLLTFLNTRQISGKLSPLIGKISRQRLLVFLFAIIFISIQVPDWGRLKWSQSWFGVKIPSITFPQNSIVVMLSSEPMSYLIPYFPQKLRFVRIQGNIIHDTLIQGTLLEKRLNFLMNSHQGSFFTLSPSSSPIDNLSLEKFNLKIKANSCSEVLTNSDRLQLCQAFRQGTATHKIE